MSGRPVDWSPLAGSDPVPGDPDEIERVARSLTDMADEITRQAANLRRLSTAEGWDADAGRTFADSAGDLAGQLDRAHGRYATAGGALKSYAPELRHAQSLADTALSDAKSAQATIDAHQPSANPPASPTPEQLSAERQRQSAHDDGVSALQAAQRRLTEATGHRDEHAGRASRAIRDSIKHDGLKDSWWDKFKNWVHEHADILKAIAKIAELVATVLSTIALVISWIPVLDFLSPVLLGLAALASGVALVCNLMLALSGDGSWFDVAVDLFAVVTFGFGAKAAMAARAGRALPQTAELEQQAASRARGLQELLPAGSRGRVTMGVGKGVDANGNVRTVLGTSEPNGYLRPAVRAAVKEDEEIASGLGHAEDDIVSYMSENGIKPITVGAGRPICPPCAQVLEDVGASPATPLKVPATQMKGP